MTDATAVRPLPAGSDVDWGRVEFWLRQALRDIDFDGLSVLDIGAGDGIFSCYMALEGAGSVVALEPELDGSNNDARSTLLRRVANLGLSNVTCLPETFQAYAGPPGAFDVVLAHNVVNHLDEDAVSVLHESEQAREVFRGLLRRMGELLRPGGVLVLADCARSNFFGRLGLRNPVSPTIEWHKHQNPELWIRILGEAGLGETALHWTYPRRLRMLGPLLDNRIASYLCDSHFVVHARRPLAAVASAR